MNWKQGLIVLMLVFGVRLLSVAVPVTLVPNVPTLLPNGDTLDISITIESTNPSVMVINQAIRSANPTRAWVLSTSILPDTTLDDIPEVVVTYVAPASPNPFDVNQDNVVDGNDFWSLFIFLFWTP